MHSLIAYTSDISSIVEGGKLSDKSSILVHLYPDNIEPVIKTGRIDKVILVTKKRREHLIESVEDMLSRKNVEYKKVLVEEKWYEPYMSRHLLEPRIRTLKPRENEYPYLLRKEHRTIELLNAIVNRNIPMKINNMLFLYTHHRVPSLDLAIMLHLKYGAAVCATSPRDTGVAWACVADEKTIASIHKYMVRETRISKLMTPNILTGFILTYPQASMVGNQILVDILREIETNGRPIKITDNTNKMFPYIEAAYNGASYISYAKIKSKLIKNFTIYTDVNGRRYFLIDTTRSSPYYTATHSDNYAVVSIYLPLPLMPAILTQKKPKEIMVCGKYITPISIEETVAGYISLLPARAKRIIEKEIERNYKAIIVVFM